MNTRLHCRVAGQEAGKTRWASMAKGRCGNLITQRRVVMNIFLLAAVKCLEANNRSARCDRSTRDLVKELL